MTVTPVTDGERLASAAPPRQRRAAAGLVIPVVALLMLLSAAASPAHVTEESGPLEVEIGWGSEPPLSGVVNFVEVSVSGATGAAVAVPAGALSVEVSHGSVAETLPLVPDDETGALRAPIVPTRPGAYAFHISGVVRGQAVDLKAKCSEATFECVEESATVEFPAKDPSAGELAARIGREAARVEEASDKAGSAKRTAAIALVLAAAALVVAAALAVRAGRRGSSRS